MTAVCAYVESAQPSPCELYLGRHGIEYSIEDSASCKIEAAVEYGREAEGGRRGGKLRLNTLWEMGVAVWAGQGQWRAEGGVAWFNVSKSIWPSHYSLGLSFN